MIASSLRRLCLYCGPFLLVVAASTCVRGESYPGDDGWRRTAQGWERLHVQLVASRQSAPATLPPIHPLLLATLQASVVGAAYWRFPAKK